MGIGQGIALCTLLLCAMYGCAVLLARIVCFWMRPKDNALTVKLTIANDVPNVEQHIRYAQWISNQLRIPLSVDTDTVSDETQFIIQTLLKNS